MQYEANSKWVCNSKVYCNYNYYGNEKTTITNNKLLKRTTYSNRIILSKSLQGINSQNKKRGNSYSKIVV